MSATPDCDSKNVYSYLLAVCRKCAILKLKVVFIKGKFTTQVLG